MSYAYMNPCVVGTRPMVDISEDVLVDGDHA